MLVTAALAAGLVAAVSPSVAWGATATPVAPASNVGRVIVIDPGHGGPYNNASSAGVLEKNVNLQLAKDLRAKLQSLGFTVYMTRYTDTAITLNDIPTWHYLADQRVWAFRRDGTASYGSAAPYDDLQGRADIANGYGADAFISIHCNGMDSSAARGVETWYTAEDHDGATLAAYLQGRLVRDTGLVNRGIKQEGFYVLKWSNMPSALIEAGFISNPGDRGYLLSTSGRQTWVTAVAGGLEQYFQWDAPGRHFGRLGADEPIAAAASISRAVYKTGSAAVILVDADHWPDALAVPTLSRRINAPVLFTRSGTIPAATAAELTRLKATRVVTVGRASSFDTTAIVAVAAAAHVPTSTVEWYGGADEYATAARLARRLGLQPSRRIFAAVSGSPDAVTAGAEAANQGAPLMLLTPTGIPPVAASAIASLRAGDTVAVGGTSVIAPNTLALLPRATRYAGADRYATNVAVLQSFHGSGRIAPVFTTTTNQLLSVLAACYSGRSVRPLVFTQQRTIPTSVRVVLENPGTRMATATMISGPAAIGPLVDSAIVKSLRGSPSGSLFGPRTAGIAEPRAYERIAPAPAQGPGPAPYEP